MDGRKRGDVPAELAQGLDRFRAWRRTRKVGTRIPQPLWKLAVKLVDTHGLNRTASVLGLDYYSLKKHVEAMDSGSRSTSQTFVQFAPAPLTGMGECLIEFEDGVGASMRVHLKGHDAPDLVALGRSFWNAE